MSMLERMAQSHVFVKQPYKHALNELWGPRFTDDFVAVNYRVAISNLRSGQFYLDTLQPSTDAQRAALADAVQAHAASAQLRVQMALALTNPVSYPLMAIVVAWVTVLLRGYGFMSRLSPVAFVAVALRRARDIERSVWRPLQGVAGADREIDPGNQQQRNALMASFMDQNSDQRDLESTSRPNRRSYRLRRRALTLAVLTSWPQASQAEVK